MEESSKETMSLNQLHSRFITSSNTKDNPYTLLSEMKNKGERLLKTDELSTSNFDDLLSPPSTVDEVKVSPKGVADISSFDSSDNAPKTETEENLEDILSSKRGNDGKDKNCRDVSDDICYSSTSSEVTWEDEVQSNADEKCESKDTFGEPASSVVKHNSECSFDDKAEEPPTKKQKVFEDKADVKYPQLSVTFTAPSSEPAPEKLLEAQCASIDKFRDLPPEIIGNILSNLPVQEVVRTSILSKEWRYRWLDTFRLVFEQKELSNTLLNERESFLRSINQVLLLHKMPIIEFAIVMVDATNGSYEIDNIIKYLWLKNNAIQNFRLSFKNNAGYSIHSCLLKLNRLKHLELAKCDFHLQLPFPAFSDIKSMVLDEVSINSRTLLHILSSCPSLKNFTLTKCCSVGDDKAEKPTILELFECLPDIQQFTTDPMITQAFAEPVNQKNLPTSLINLKLLALHGLRFSGGEPLPFLLFWLRSSPYLEELRLQTGCELCNSESTALRSYSDIKLHCLKRLEIRDFLLSRTELEFLKISFVNSSTLQKVSIWVDNKVTNYQRIRIRSALSRFPQASPRVKVVIVH